MGTGRQPLRAAFLALGLVWSAGAAAAEEARTGDARGAARTAVAERVCALIEVASGRHDLPPAFLARLIWLESRFDLAAVSPKGALGVAQFMPATARLRGLDDPFDPHLAIPAAATYLAELRARFGNLGLAAAAYNSGEARVSGWLAGKRGLPGETLAYVHAITFRPAGWFREAGREVEPRPLDEARPFAAACRDLPVMKTRAVLFEGATWQPWGVQVAGNVRRAAALAHFGRLQSRHAAIIGDRVPMVLRQRMAGRPVWAVRLGAGSRAEAQALCARLRAAAAACVVIRN